MAAGGGSAVVIAPPGVRALTASPEGGWPSVTGQALYRDGVVYWGWVNSSGDVMVGAYDEATAVVTSFELKTAFEVDWHGSPALCVRSDGRLVAAYCKHDADTVLYVRLSTNAGDISAWGAETNIDPQIDTGDAYTYTYPVLFTDDAGTLWLFYRQWTTTTSKWSYTTSTDSGATWAPDTVFYQVAATSTYMHIAHDGVDRFDFVVSDGDAGTPTPDTHVYHFSMRDGVRYKTDGTVIAALPLGPSDLTLVHTGAAVSPLNVIGNGGAPVIICPTYDGTTVTYHYAAWDGAAWNVETMVAYPWDAPPWGYAGACLDGAGTVYLSLPVAGVYSLNRYRTWDAGASWTTDVLASSPSDDFYPVPVTDPHRLRAVALRGTASSFTSYTLQTIGIASY